MTGLLIGNRQKWLTDIRMRAANVLTEEICESYTIGFDHSKPDRADVHEDVREALWSFFDEIDRTVAQAEFRSTPEILRVLDEYDDYTSMLTQGYAHSKEPIPDEWMQVLKLGCSLSHRVRSHFRESESRV